jgi:hypothetical protein
MLQVFEIVLLLSLVGMLAETDFLDGWLLGFCIAAATQLAWIFVLCCNKVCCVVFSEIH